MTVEPAVRRPRGRPARFYSEIRQAIAVPKKWHAVYRGTEDACRAAAHAIRTQTSYRTQAAAGHLYVVTRPDGAKHVVKAYYQAAKGEQ